MCTGGFRGHKSSNRIELSWFIQELLYFFWFGFPWLWGVGQVGGWCPGWSTIVYMSSGMLRGKESSNRIEISWLVQDLFNFGVLGSLWLWRGGRWVGGGVWGHLGHGGCHHMHTHACKHMYRNCKWPSTWRHPCVTVLGYPLPPAWSLSDSRQARQGLDTDVTPFHNSFHILQPPGQPFDST